ncbi:DEAD/DEAH box helicase family protein [uncultured Anaerobiospirillum sp.]|uniref:type I restriction endonuclease subunit R n=1 Tax=uncultured Anaerobiospirillum sp. TaxID=265728 RepID=UPI002803F41B|nr:DEAD/DEAH box helicase family protein [uncultured Anaerobiospirillum sp.]
MKTFIQERNDFQKYIIEQLQASNGYLVRNAKTDYDKRFAMDPSLLFRFLDETQPDEMAAFRKIHKDEANKSLIEHINNQIVQNGLVFVLKNGVELGKGHKINLMCTKPASKMNTKLTTLYDNNIFSVMEEVVISDKERIDLVVFLNGLAIISFELKSNASGKSVDDAVEQYRKQRDPKNRLFLFKAGTLVNFAMDLNEVRMTTQLDKEETYFLPFNMGNGTGVNAGAGNPIIPGKYSVSYMWEDILKKDTLIDLISHFIFVEITQKIDPLTDKLGKPKERQIFPRFHQLDAVRRIIEDVKVNKSSCNYLIQHSAGSGKTNTIAWLAHRLVSQFDEDDKVIFNTVLVVTDRVIVDRQLQEAVRKLDHKAGLIRVIDNQSTSADLADALQGRAKIICTTLQKFPYVLDSVRQLKDRRFAVIIDEAHSSTSGKNMGALTRTLSKDDDTFETIEDKFTDDIRKHGKQENVSFFAFTATPKATTIELFGTLNCYGHKQAFHLYSMKQAIEEGFILDVLSNYVEYKTFYQLNKAIEDDPKVKTSDAKRQIARFIQLHDTNIAQRIEIIVEHFRQNIQPELGGRAKAMVVTPSREAAVKYYQAFKQYVDEHQYSNIKPLVAFSGKVVVEDDGNNEYTESGLNGFAEDKLPSKFDSDDYQVLLVADKYQTGFDQPKLCAMYVLKALNGVTAVQTLSRLNRICPPFNKRTFVMDFVNTYEKIRDAFAPYYTATFLANSVNTSSIIELESKIDGYYIIDYSDIDALVEYIENGVKQPRGQIGLQNSIRRVVDRFKKLETTDQKEFKALVGGFIRLYEFLIQATSFEDVELHKKYLFLTVLIDQLNIGSTGNGVNLKGKLAATNFQQKQVKETLNPKQISNAFVKLATAEGFIISEEMEEKLSEIIDKINSMLGKNFDPNIVVPSLLQIKNLLLKSDALKSSAQNNTEEDFKFAFFDRADDELVAGWEKNKEFFFTILENEDVKQELLGIFVPEVYRHLNASISMQ